MYRTEKKPVSSYTGLGPLWLAAFTGPKTAADQLGLQNKTDDLFQQYHWLQKNTTLNTEHRRKSLVSPLCVRWRSSGASQRSSICWAIWIWSTSGPWIAPLAHSERKHIWYVFISSWNCWRTPTFFHFRVTATSGLLGKMLCVKPCVYLQLFGGAQ